MGKLKQLDAKIKTEKTKVIFRKFPDGEVIALFPELPGDNDVRNCLSYQKIGQHGKAEASLNYTKPAKYDYMVQHLINELTAIGYTLTVVTRFSYQMDQKRIAALRASRA